MLMLPNLDLGDLQQGLQRLEKNYDQVADADMDAMFVQVRGGGPPSSKSGPDCMNESARWASMFIVRADKICLLPCLFQVRTEERTGARDLLGGITDQAKHVLEAKMAALGPTAGEKSFQFGKPTGQRQA
jgi:hypothetical protein